MSKPKQPGKYRITSNHNGKHYIATVIRRAKEFSVNLYGECCAMSKIGEDEYTWERIDDDRPD